MKKLKNYLWWIVIALIAIVAIGFHVIYVIDLLNTATIESIVTFVIVILFFIGAAFYNKNKRKTEEFDNELKKEKGEIHKSCL